MTYNEDPRRWTSSPEEAPELLRGAFSAGRSEGPSRTQMRSLALKIAAVSAGGAVAVGTVQAASVGHAASSAATWSIGKIASMVAIAGTLATSGAVLWQDSAQRAQLGRGESVAVAGGRGAPSDPTTPIAAANGTPASATSAVSAGPEEATPTLNGAPTESAKISPARDLAREGQAEQPTVEMLGTSKRAPDENTGRAQIGGSAAPVASPAARSDDDGTQPNKPAATRARARPAFATKVEQTAPVSSGAARGFSGSAEVSETKQHASTGGELPKSELSLLRRAQVALQGRPREAFQLTEEHRRLYPSGEFAQERDALAIEALMRAGESEKARDLAQSFIRAYPSSPHAHRFREAMGLR